MEKRKGSFPSLVFLDSVEKITGHLTEETILNVSSLNNNDADFAFTDYMFKSSLLIYCGLFYMRLI